MAFAWQHKSSFKYTNRLMLDREILCDVTLIVGEPETEIKCHKFILASRSPVFHTMFCGALAESGDPIRMPDIRPHVMKEFLRYLYTDCCLINGDTVMELIYASKKYDVFRLWLECKRYLQNTLSLEDACVVLEQAMGFGEKDLEMQCIQMIERNAIEVFRTNTFLDMQRKTLKRILELNNLNCEEDDVYRACKAWAAKKTCNVSNQDIKDTLGDVVSLIRFEAIVDKTTAEEENILPVKKKSKKEDEHYIENFDLCKLRRRSKSVEIIRFNEITSTPPWTHCNKTDVLSFTVSVDAYLTGVSLFLPIEQGEVEGKLQVLQEHDESEKLHQHVWHTIELALKHEPGKKYTHIKLPPVLLHACTRYTIKQTMKGQDTYYGEKAKVFEKDHNINVEFLHLYSYGVGNGTGVNIGQVYGISLFVPDIYTSDPKT